MLDVLLSLSLASLASVSPPSAVATTNALPQNPDVIQLKSGRKLTGKILSESGPTVRFDDLEIGPVTIARTRAHAVLHEGKSDDIMSPTWTPETAPRLIGDYVSFRPPSDKDPGALQTASTRWYQEATDTTLFLLSNSKIGESTYFAKLQHALDSMDLVLFEDNLRPEDPKTTEMLARANFVMRLQIALETALDLDSLGHSIDSHRSFWRRTDLDTMALQTSLKGLQSDLSDANPKANILLGRILESMDPDNTHKHPRLLMQIRNSMAPVLVLADQALRGEGLEDLRRTIIEDRNDAVRSELANELEKGVKGRRIAIFYGAEHMPDFDSKLRRSGWTYEGSTWYEAWPVRRAPRQARPEAAAFREILAQAKKRVHPDLKVSAWLGLRSGRAMFEQDSHEPMLATNGIAPLLLLELFSQYANQLDDPAPNLNSIIATSSHPAIVPFATKELETLRYHLKGVSVRHLATAMLGRSGTPEIVRHGAANLIVALLRGPERVSKLVRRRHPTLSRFSLGRYPHELTDTDLGLVSTRGLASILQGIASREIPGLDQTTTNSLRDLLFTNDNDLLGRHFSIHGSARRGRSAITRAGFYEHQGHDLVYVIQASLPDLDVRQRSEAQVPMHLTANWLELHLTTSLRSRVQ